ncbi:MAG: anti-sigma factor [Bacteroidales bacterium]|nr:anti-sigma factor [Bacteroidales bacterium]
MSKGFDDILKDRIKELPSYAPDERLWKAVHTELDAEEAVSMRLPDLPVHMPAPGTWEAVEAALPASLPVRPSRRLLWLAAGIAAAVILILVIPLFMRSGDKIIVESEVVLSEAQDHIIMPEQSGEDPIEIIRKLCTTGAPVCRTELFLEKMQLYRELDEELRHLESVIGKVGDSPEIIQSIILIENLKSDTLQELIQLIHS